MLRHVNRGGSQILAPDFVSPLIILHHIRVFTPDNLSCCWVEQVVQVASYKAKSTGVSDVAVQPVVDNFPHHQIMFFHTRFFHLMLLWSLLLSRLCSLCKCRCCSLALFLSLPWLQKIFIPDIYCTRKYFTPDNIFASDNFCLLCHCCSRALFFCFRGCNWSKGVRDWTDQKYDWMSLLNIRHNQCNFKWKLWSSTVWK